MTLSGPTTLPQVQLPAAVCRDPAQNLDREWLVTNGIGGYASGTVGGPATRCYHALLAAALTPPAGRTVLLAALEETVEVGGRRYSLDSHEYRDGTLAPQGFAALTGFRLEGGLPVWSYDLDGVRLERRVWMPRGRNTVFVGYRLLGGPHSVRLTVAPLVCRRDYHSETRGAPDWTMPTTVSGRWWKVAAWEGAAPLSLRLTGEHAAHLEERGVWYWGFLHRREQERGLDCVEDLYCPGAMTVQLARGGSAVLTATAERPGAEEADPMAALAREFARRAGLLDQARAGASDPLRQHLTLAADAFLATRGRGAGKGATVLAGYHWFTDWSRDAMISLPGLCLATGRHAEAREVLRTFARFADRGMLPNRFPDDGGAPEYNTVDGTLWFFHALNAYDAATGDGDLLDELFPRLEDIIGWHLRGTRFGIGADPADGLLRAGEAGVALTWMDARAGEWVVTPRQGKPVEIQALWYGALRAMGRWAVRRGRSGAHPYEKLAEQVRASFNARFWCEAAGHLYDVVDGPEGDDATLRPNQLFAISLPDPVLDQERWQPVVRAVEEQLAVPLGLRTQAPATPGYVGHYGGSPWERDGAYHRGTAWPWLLGPFVDAHRRAFPEAPGLPGGLQAALADHLRQAGLGTVSEVLDGDAPHGAGGCIAQAWSVAELLRVLARER